jgi:hypothetical protein
MYTQAWRSYGGTQNYEKSNNATINNLVVGNLTLKSQYLGFFDILGPLTVTGKTTLNGDMLFNGDETLNGNLTVAGNAAFSSDVLLSKSLDVLGSVVVNGTVTVNKTFNIRRDIQVGGNVYVAKNVLAMGYNFTSNPQNDNPTYSGALVCNAFHAGGFMGVNSPYYTRVLPGATLDVFSDSSANAETTTAFNVFATGTRTQSILSSNAGFRGTVLYTDPSQCSLHWFSDTAMVHRLLSCETNTDVSYIQYPFVTDPSANSGDAVLTYQNGGNMTLAVANNITLPSHLSVGTSVLGSLDGSGGVGGHTAFQETVVVYSDGSGMFLPDYFTEDAGALGGYAAQTAVTMVTSPLDPSEGGYTALTMVMEAEGSGPLGMRMLGGSYIYDSSRATMATGLVVAVGEMDRASGSGGWVPVQTTVQNANPAFGRSVTGFNTYAPPLDGCTMMVNGPTRIVNGEVVLVYDVSFELERVVTSARVPTVALAFGAPNVYDSSNNEFRFSFLSSVNGGSTWSERSTSGPRLVNLSSNNRNVARAGVAYDAVSALVALNYEGHVFVTSDAYKTWDVLFLNYPGGGPNGKGFTNGVEAMAVLDIDRSGNLLVMVDTSNSSQDAPGYNLGYSLFPSTCSFSPTTTVGPDGVYKRTFHTNDVSFTYTHFPTGMNAVHALGGFDTSYVFVAGSGIAKYAVRYDYIAPTHVATWNWNGPYTYRALATLRTYATDLDGVYLVLKDPLVSVFVGDGIITWTSDGGRSYTDVSMGLEGMVFKDVAVYDAKHAVVTGTYAGKSGVMLATYDGGYTWTTPYEAFNGAGTAGLLLAPDVSRNLISVAQTSLDDFLVGRVDEVYDIDISGAYGASRLYHCHVPNLFHRSAVVLDVSGSVSIAGSLGIADALTVGGTITCPVTTIQSDYRLKTDVVSLDEVASAGVDGLRPLQYVNTTTGRGDIGFFAHEVAELYPFLVHGDKDASGEFQSLNYTGLIGILVKEVQALKATVASLMRI